MSATVLYMSMSLDGLIAGPNETLHNGLGDGGSAYTTGQCPMSRAALQEPRSAARA